MGEADRYQEYKHLKPKFSVFRSGNALMALVALNLIFFLTLFTIQVGFYSNDRSLQEFYHEVIEWFVLPSGLTRFSERPWTILSFMFSEPGNNFINLLSNMLWLWAFGYILQQLSGNDKLIPVYLYGGMAAGIFFLTASHIPGMILSDNAFLIGANGAVMGVAAATTTLSPGFRILRHLRNGIPLWTLTLVYLFIDLAGISGLPAAYSLSHIGGGLGGVVFMLLLKRGIDGSAWMNKVYRTLRDLFSPAGNKKPGKETLYYDTGKVEPFTKNSSITQQRIDEILDKINQKGYHFLTVEEKEILRKASEEGL